MWLWFSICVNLGILGFFKYFGFFTDSLASALAVFGVTLNSLVLDVVLPVGISFYTFQTMAYTIDVYNKKTAPSENLVAFFAYVAFFPQLVAGPIERAKDLLPQFLRRRQISVVDIQDGGRQILWGLFKKVVIADTVAPHVDFIFDNYASLDSLTLFLGAVLFGIQIYCDFSGYSDMAVGLARLLGFRLTNNFAYPYFSRSVSEFWRRWHITLSNWFRDYVFIPLGGSRTGKWLNIRNITITFLLSGLWHGAQWHYVLWGGFFALCFVPRIIFNKIAVGGQIAENRLLPHWREFLSLIITQLMVVFAWILFRAESMAVAAQYVTQLFIGFDVSMDYSRYYQPLLLSIGLMAWEWVQRTQPHGLQIAHFSMPVRYSVYAVIFVLLLEIHNPVKVPFVYFQF